MKDLIKLHAEEIYDLDFSEVGHLSELIERVVSDDYESALPKVYDRRAVPRPEPWESGYHRRKLVDCVRAAARRLRTEQAQQAERDYWQDVEDESWEEAQRSEYE